MTADIAAALFRCPPPLRTPLADKLYPQGVRMHPELATAKLVVEGPENMGNWRPSHLENLPDAVQPQHSEKLAQVRGIANALSSIPRPDLRPAIANDLYQLGGRIHPDLAETQPEPAPQQPGLTALRDPFEIVQHFAPKLADQMRAAETEEQRAAIREQIRHEHGSRIAQLAEGIERLQEP